MDAMHYEALRKMFDAQRLHPWEPEHALFIKGEIAKLKVTEPKDAERHEAFYAEKMKVWEETPDDPVVDSKIPSTTFSALPLPSFPTEETATPAAIEMVTPEKPKRGRPKIS